MAYISEKNYYAAILEIIRTGHWITDQVSVQLKEFAVTEQQYNVLKILKGRKGAPISVSDIQQRMVQRSSNVTRIVDKLLARGFADRSECAANRRKMDISITSGGLEFLKKLDRKVAIMHKPMKGNLTDKELDTLTVLIRKLKKGVEK